MLRNTEWLGGWQGCDLESIVLVSTVDTMGWVDGRDVILRAQSWSRTTVLVHSLGLETTVLVSRRYSWSRCHDLSCETIVLVSNHSLGP